MSAFTVPLAGPRIHLGDIFIPHWLFLHVDGFKTGAQSEVLPSLE